MRCPICYSNQPAGRRNPDTFPRRYSMAISVYDFSVPMLIRGLTNLSAILDKAPAHAEAKKFDASALAQPRLSADMFPLGRQVHVACDTAKGAAARLAGIDPPQHEDTEATLPELKQRIAKTVDFLRTVKPDMLKDAEGRSIELKFPNGTQKFTALAYLTDFVLPNFYFHVSMVYALLRKSGIEIGKPDYLGPRP